MRVLLDENLDRKLKTLFDAIFDVTTVIDLGWQGTKNGALLRMAVEAGFDVFVTRDKNLIHQQNLSEIDLAIVILLPRSSVFEVVADLIPKANEAIRSIEPRQIVHIGLPN